MTTIVKTERKGFESLIAHLLFPQKISRSDSSDIPNYLVCVSAKS